LPKIRDRETFLCISGFYPFLTLKMEMIEKKYKIGFIIGSLMLIIAGVIYPITDSVTVVLLEDNISLQSGF